MTKPVRKKQILWKPEYSLNIEEIDNEHKKLFDISQKALLITSASSLNESKEKLKEIILELLKYTKSHFMSEQTYMRSINYPDFQNHTLLHKKMVDELMNLIKNINSLDFLEIENILYNFMEEYFLNHIIMEDKKIHLWNAPLEILQKTIHWKDVYKVNNHHIDKDHKMLFDIAVEAFVCSIDNKDRMHKLRVTIKNLYDYMKLHFKNEEKYMKDINYPKLQEHKVLHENIIISLNEFIKNIPNIKIETFEVELAKMIDIVLLQHIIQEDRKITQWESETI